MRTKRKSQEVPAVQLCLFSQSEMDSMIEQITIKPIDLFTADPARLRWELEIGQLLSGKPGREHRRTFAQRRRRVAIVRAKPPNIFLDS